MGVYVCARSARAVAKLGGGCGFVLIWHVAGPALTAFISVRGAVSLCFVFCPPCRCAPPARPRAAARALLLKTEFVILSMKQASTRSRAQYLSTSRSPRADNSWPMCAACTKVRQPAALTALRGLCGALVRERSPSRQCIRGRGRKNGYMIEHASRHSIGAWWSETQQIPEQAARDAESEGGAPRMLDRRPAAGWRTAAVGVRRQR